ncbi:MAG: hypothetical protein H6721_03425 [Sandaracinus sp.]|nr:hypothetical protein [Sandaracinus sp.]MCB9624016.1 hypothetical protein [Sandaracinus sp.]MCB9631184.1 hypothetical protein [Sandaracinus sp.]
MRRRLLSLALSFAFACGGLARQELVVEAPPDAVPLTLEAVHRAVLERGFEARYQPGQRVVFHVDRAQGTRLTFVAKRRGVVMVAGVRGADELPPGEAEARLVATEGLGRELAARAAEWVPILEEEARREEAERAEAERARSEARAARRAERAERRAELAAFVDANTQRTRSHGVSVEANTSEAHATPSSSARCCINGAFYECPDAASVDLCVGRFTRCISGCGLSCMESCLQSDPPDPSGCSRTPARDGEC